MSPNNEAFAGYRWNYFSSLGDNPIRSRAEKSLKSTNWNSLIEYATAKRNGVECSLLPDIGLGYNHMVCILEFTDNVRWVARLRQPGMLPDKNSLESAKSAMECEYSTIKLVQKESTIPVPRIHAIESTLHSKVGAQFMLMDCLRGNVGMDLSLEVPSEHKKSVFTSMAEIHVSLSRIQLPKIGTITSINDDGSYQQGPIPGLGGPFETAAEFFKAWSAKVNFGSSPERIKMTAGEYADELMESASLFKTLINDFAENLSVRNNGPFPLCHGDFGHNNIIFDDNYQLLGAIDWEFAFAGPWEISCEFPLTLSTVPPAMGPPWNYDERGLPKDADGKQRLLDQEQYIAIVREKEQEQGLVDGYNLSSALQDSKRQHLATAMSLYQTGKPGWFSKVLDPFVDDKGCAK